MNVEIKEPMEVCIVDDNNVKIYHYIDKENGINILTKEIFKNEEKIIHYPFYRKGTKKYQKIEKITFMGFKNENSIPRGFYKNWKKGYGATKVYLPLFRELENRYDINEIVIGKDIKNKIDKKNKIIYINYNDLDKHYTTADSLLKEQRQEQNNLAINILSKIFPRNIRNKNKDEYIPGSLKRYITTKLNLEKLSDDDKNAILDLISELPDFFYLQDKQKILDTKEMIDKYYIEDVVKEFEKIINIKQKKETKQLEEKWHKFFEEYHWIFSQLFSTPAIFYRSKAYVGGKGFDNANGKIVDFLYHNELTNSLAIIEIKTHLSKLLKSSQYRGSDVYPMSEDLSGGIAQVLDQKDNLQKEFIDLKKGEKVESYNPKCILVIGMVKDLTEEQQKSFELIRSNSKDVEIITFDELFQKIKGLKKIIMGEE